VDGTEQVRQMSQETVYEMKKAMGLTGVWNRLRRRAERRAKKLEKQGETPQS
jgi:tryptophanyl-tRNA synthetase